MATLLDFSIYQAVERDGLPRVAHYDDGIDRVLYLNGSPFPASMLASDWPPPLPTAPTQPQIDAAIAARAAAAQAAATAAAALRQTIITQAQSAVGLSINALNAGQRNALMACLFWQAGAIADDLTVKPLAQWVQP